MYLNSSESEKEKLKRKLEDMKTILNKKIDIQKQLPNLMRVLVDRVEVEKINNDRNKVRLTIYFDFNTNIVDRELELDARVIRPVKKIDMNTTLISSNNGACDERNGASANHKHTNINSEISENKGLNNSLGASVYQSEPRICSFGTKTWKK